MSYCHLTENERYLIGHLHAFGRSIRCIAKELVRAPGRVGIEHRPVIVEDRQRFGDWESDTMQGTKGIGNLVTHVERRSRYLVAGLAADGQAKTFNEATIRLFSCVPRQLRHTMTADNGKEFTQFKTLERKLGVKVYFANPYSAWERGANENTKRSPASRCCASELNPPVLCDIQPEYRGEMAGGITVRDIPPTRITFFSR